MTSLVPDSQDVTPKSIPGYLACSAANRNETDARIWANRVRNPGREHSGLVLNIPTRSVSPFWFPPHFQFPPHSKQAAARSSAPRSTSPYQRLWRHLLDTCSLHPSKRKEHRGCQWELIQNVPSPRVTTSHYSPLTPQPVCNPQCPSPRVFLNSAPPIPNPSHCLGSC